MRILINALPAKMGGNANYLKEVAALLPKLAPSDEFIFLVPPEQVIAVQKAFPAAEIIGNAVSHAPFWKRVWFDQLTLRRMIRRRKVDSLFSTADFAMFACPCHQVLLIRNPTHFFKMYLDRYLPRQNRKARTIIRLRAWLSFRSVKAADIVLTPSQTTLDELRRCVDVPETKGFANLYGVNAGKFSAKSFAPKTTGPWKLLFVSLYTDHKNLVTLLHAMKELVAKGKDMHLTTTADPNWAGAQSTQSWASDSSLASSPQLAGHIDFALKDAAAAPKNLYDEADIFVYPSVVETFGHALVEAMSSGLPVVAADVPINRELCGDAALYFSPFDSRDCAAKIEVVCGDAALRKRLSANAFQRSQMFSWEKHVSKLLACMKARSPEVRTVLERAHIR